MCEDEDCDELDGMLQSKFDYVFEFQMSLNTFFDHNSHILSRSLVHKYHQQKSINKLKLIIFILNLCMRIKVCMCVDSTGLQTG